MDEQIFSHIVALSSKMIAAARVEKTRDVTKEIITTIKSKPDLYLIHGLRGVGKTTLLSELSYSIQNSIYLNGDVIIKYGADLLDLLHYLEKTGYTTFLIDEVHSIAEWEKDIKIFRDETHANIVLTGSSAAAIKIKGSELSRRAKVFELKPLSFREYLFFRTGNVYPKLTLEQIVHTKNISSITKGALPYLNELDVYMYRNALPACFFENKPEAYLGIVERAIRYDLQTLKEIDAQYVETAFKVIKFVATSSPGEVSYTKIANSIHRTTRVAQEIVKMLSYAGLLYIVPPAGAGHKAIRSEDKILMPLSFRAMLCEEYGVLPSQGGVREDFFIQHIEKASYLKSGFERRTPDYVVGKYIFEVGGESKGWQQLKGKNNAYLVKETILVQDKEIPLYLFGFLY